MQPNSLCLSNYIKQLCWRFRFYLIFLIIIAACAASLALLVNYSIKQVIDDIAYNSSQNLTNLLLLFTGYKFSYHGMYFIRRILDIHFNPKIIQTTLTNIYQQTIQHSMHWFESHLSGEISNKIADFQNSINNIINHK